MFLLFSMISLGGTRQVHRQLQLFQKPSQNRLGEPIWGMNAELSGSSTINELLIQALAVWASNCDWKY